MTDLNIAIIGAGNVSQIHVAAVLPIPGAKISVVCNQGAARGQQLAELANAEWVPDVAAVLARADVDVVIIGTPSGTHHDLAVAAMRAGKHALVEKPLEITLSRIDHMLEVAAETGVHLGCIFQSRMREGAQAAKRTVDAGRLGELIFANAFIPWSRDTAYYQDNWRGTWALDGGGALMNQSIHSIDLLQWLAGDVSGVMAVTAARRHAIETEDTGTAVLRFANGAQGVIQGTTALSRGHDALVELQGTKGSILLVEGSIEEWQIDDAHAGEEVVPDLDSSHAGGASDPMAIGCLLHQKQIEQFLTAVREGTADYVSGREARKSVEIVRAVYQSAASGALVPLPLVDTA